LPRRAGIADGTGLSLFQKQGRNTAFIFDRAMARFYAEGRRELAEIDARQQKLTRTPNFTSKKLVPTGAWQWFSSLSFAGRQNFNAKNFGGWLR